MSTKPIFDISSFIDVETIASTTIKVQNREKLRRKGLGFSQGKLAERSGVSLASIRRFEQTGEISFSSLLKIANALDCLEDFLTLFHEIPVKNLKDL